MADWDDDLAKILLNAPELPKGVPAVTEWLRKLMVQAWQFGYTTGMRDSATLNGELTATLEGLEDRARALQVELGRRRHLPSWFRRGRTS